MIKRTIKETITEFDDKGKMIKQTVTETTEEDDAQNNQFYYPYYPRIETVPYCTIGEQA